METSNKWHKLKNESIYPFHKFQGNAPFLQSLVGLFLFCLFLGMFTELWKATVSFVTSVCLSVSMELLSSQGTDFHESWCLTIFWKSVKKIQVSFKSDKKNDTLHEDKCAFLIISWSGLLILRNVSERSCSDNQKRHFISIIFFFSWKLCCLWQNVEQFCRARQSTNDSMAHMHSMLDTYGYKYTLRTCNTYWFSTATMLAWTHFLILFYVQCLPCSLLYSRFIIFK